MAIYGHIWPYTPESMYLGCLDLYFGCLEMYFKCPDLYFCASTCILAPQFQVKQKSLRAPPSRDPVRSLLGPFWTQICTIALKIYGFSFIPIPCWGIYGILIWDPKHFPFGHDGTLQIHYNLGKHVFLKQVKSDWQNKSQITIFAEHLK